MEELSTEGDADDDDFIDDEDDDSAFTSKKKGKGKAKTKSKGKSKAARPKKATYAPLPSGRNPKVMLISLKVCELDSFPTLGAHSSL